MGNYPSMGTQGGTVIGALEFNACYDMPCCKPCGPWNSANCMNCPCCPGLKAPAGPEWEAAQEGFAPFLEEATATCVKAGGCCSDPFKQKAALDADWTGRANTYLATHKLKLEVFAFYTSNGKSAEPHLVLQFVKTE